MPTQQSLSADALFAFGKAQLRSADNAELDALADKLKAAAQIDSVQVLGYTDRIGSEQANQKLSAQRAETVRDYRSEEHTSELQSLMRNSYAVFCLKTKQKTKN